MFTIEQNDFTSSKIVILLNYKDRWRIVAIGLVHFCELLILVSVNLCEENVVRELTQLIEASGHLVEFTQELLILHVWLGRVNEQDHGRVQFLGRLQELLVIAVRKGDHMAAVIGQQSGVNDSKQQG